MRAVMYGAGAVGGVVGARLFEAGHSVTLIARGAHFEAIRDRGLRLDCGEDSTLLPIPVVDHPGAVDFTDAVVFLAMKTQDTTAALAELSAVAGADAPVVCLQNGVENERLALRRFERVYGICVMCPAGHLEPGVVQAFSAPTTALLDVGRYPSGVDDVAESVASALSEASCMSEPRPDILRWKYRKLLMNLLNSVQALCGVEAGFGEMGRRVMEEGETVLAGAGIEVASAQEDIERRADHLMLRPVTGEPRRGGSSWQSLARGQGTIETDYLNGEIVLLGRQVGIETPANALMQRLASEAVRNESGPGGFTEDALLALL